MTEPWLKFDWYPAGHELIRQGGRSGALVVLKDGELEVLRDGAFISSTRRPGAIFGEMSVLLDLPHTATVRAVSDTEVYVIEDALRVLEQHPGWLLQIARLLAQRVNATTALLTKKQRTDTRETMVLPETIFSQWSDPAV